jgi:hypothetical protein
MPLPNLGPPTFRRLSISGRAFRSARSRSPLSRAACNSSFDATAISPSFSCWRGRSADGDPTHALVAQQSHSFPERARVVSDAAVTPYEINRLVAVTENVSRPKVTQTYEEKRELTQSRVTWESRGRNRHFFDVPNMPMSADRRDDLCLRGVHTKDQGPTLERAKKAARRIERNTERRSSGAAISSGGS